MSPADVIVVGTHIETTAGKTLPLDSPALSLDRLGRRNNKVENLRGRQFLCKIVSVTKICSIYHP